MVLLTLKISNPQVIGKLSEGRATHIPYRDSKLTRLLQSSLSGHGHVSVSTNLFAFFCSYSVQNSLHGATLLAILSLWIEIWSSSDGLTYILQLICTITPASSNMEETHNTLKFASRAKRVEIYAARNRVSILGVCSWLLV